MNNKELYNKIMHNISKEIKYVLTEEIQNFNPIDYEDNDSLSVEDIDDVLEIPKTKEQLQKKIVIETEKNETRPDLSNIDISLITDMSSLFDPKKYPIFNKIKYLDLSSWNTSHVTNMNGMFAGMNLNELKLTNWDTSNVIDMSYMFNELRIKTLDVSMFDLSSVISMHCIFAESKVKNLDLSNWEISEGCQIDSMFRGFNKQQKVKVSLTILVALIKNEKQFIELPDEILQINQKPNKNNTNTNTNTKVEKLINTIKHLGTTKIENSADKRIYDRYIKGTIINNCIAGSIQPEYDQMGRGTVSNYPIYIKFIKNPLTGKDLSKIKERADIRDINKKMGIKIYMESTSYSLTGDVLSEKVIESFMNQNKNTGTYGIFIEGRVILDNDFTLMILDTDNNKIIAGKSKFTKKLGITDNLTIDKDILSNYVPDYIAIASKYI